MATTKQKPASAKPATQDAPKKQEPAKEKPAKPAGVGIHELAADLGRTPRSVRASIRRIKGGPQVGQGGRYSWNSKTDPAYKSLLKELQEAGAKKQSDEDA
jgi:hypothetical protein